MTFTPAIRPLVTLSLITITFLALLALLFVAPRPGSAQDDTEGRVPDRPNAPTLTLETDNSVLVRWEAPDDGGSPISGYSITVMTNTGAGFSTDVGNKTQHLLTDLNSNTYYSVDITAKNRFGQSRYSPASRIRTPGNEAMELPTVPSYTWKAGDAVDAVLPAATSGDAPLTYSVVGLPNGLSFDPETRRISGTPSAAGSGTATYTATDNDGDKDSESLSWTVQPANPPPTNSPPTNKALSVSVTPRWPTVDAGETITLDGTAKGPDDNPLTYTWTASPDIGQYSSTSTPDTTWTAPASYDEPQLIILTLTVSDGSDAVAAATVEVSMGYVPLLEAMVEDMLNDPSESDASLTVEEKHPWLRQTWDYIQKTGKYASLNYEFELRANSSEIPWVAFECFESTADQPLGRCQATSFTMTKDLLTDEFMTGRYAFILKSILAHELAHVFKFSSPISRDGTAVARPDLNAVAMMYFHHEYDCVEPPGELMADVMQVMVYPSSWGGYWYDCGYGYEMPAQAIEVVQSMLSGEYPDWFTEKYGLTDGGFALRRLWRDTIDSELTIDPFYKQLWVWQLRDAFGSRYCDPQSVARSAYMGYREPTNPWSNADDDKAGCQNSATGAPTISGRAQEGETLTADVSAIEDADGLDNAVFSYQWIADDGSSTTDIQGAAGSTYTIVADDEGKTIKVRVTFTDDAGTEEYLTSEPTETVTATSPVTIALSPSGPVEAGTAINVTVSFSDLEYDSDTSDTDYIFRADVLNSDGTADDQCEDTDGGYGLGVNRYMYQVDENPEIRTGSISASCPAGDYAVRASISSPDNVELASASVDFTIRSVGQQPTPEPLSTDATLNGLSLSSVNIGAFDPNTVTYTAEVSNDVAETTVTATTNDDGATYTIHLNSVADADGIIPLAVGSNVITVKVTAEDSLAIETYTVTVTRAAPLSTDATLSSLSLSNINFGAFDPATVAYTVSVGNEVVETTVTPTANDAGATHVVEIDGAEDGDRVIPLAVGSNVITVEVTAEDGNTAKTYTVTVTRDAPPSTDATLSSLTLSNAPFTFDSATTGYTASVANDVVETTVTPTTNDGRARYVVKLGDAVDGDGTVELSVGSNVITVEVTAEDGKTTKTYTVTVTRAEPPAPGPAVAVELSPSGSVEEGTEIALTMSFANLESDTDTSTTDYVFRADVVNADGCEGGGMGVDRNINKVDEEPEVRTGTISAFCAPGDYTVEVSISSPDNVELASATADFTVNAPSQQQQPEPPSTDATLKGLALSDVALAFDPATTEYNASVANDVDETTVTLTANDGGATYAIKRGGVADADGVISLAVGSNVITIEVAAEDGKTTKTYTVTVTRADSPPPEPEPDPESTGERGSWLESNPENQPFVGEWQHFTLRGNGLAKVDLQVNVIGFDGAPSSTGAVGYSTASPPPAAGEACESADYSGYQMSVDSTFSLVGCREGTVVIELLDPGNDWALLKRYTVTVNAGP